MEEYSKMSKEEKKAYKDIKKEKMKSIIKNPTGSVLRKMFGTPTGTPSTPMTPLILSPPPPLEPMTPVSKPRRFIPTEPSDDSGMYGFGVAYPAYVPHGKTSSGYPQISVKDSGVKIRPPSNYTSARGYGVASVLPVTFNSKLTSSKSQPKYNSKIVIDAPIQPIEV